MLGENQKQHNPDAFGGGKNIGVGQERQTGQERQERSNRVARVNFVNIPSELKSTCSFCVWKLEKRKGQAIKVPYNAKNGQTAKTNDVSTFSDFATVMKAYAMGGPKGDWDGIGFRISDGIGAIDIDHCIRPDGSLNDVAASILSFLKTAYFERSPSGSGLRGFFKLSSDFIYDRTVYYVNNRKHGLEVYLPGATNRFVTVTGDVYRMGTVDFDDEGLRNVLDTFMRRAAQKKNDIIEAVSYLTDEQVIRHASGDDDGGNSSDDNGSLSESAMKFRDLMAGKWEDRYDSQSEADMALVMILAFWCGNVEEQIDRIFRTSGLMRDKWDRATGDSTYGAITIRNAVATNNTVYSPIARTSAEDDFTAVRDDADDADAAEYDDAVDEDDSDVADEDDVVSGGEHRRCKKGHRRHREKRPAFTPDYSRITLTLEDMQPHTNPRYGMGEIGIGYAFADYYRPIARFNANRGIWYVYDGKIWRPDEKSLAVYEMAKKLADRLYAFALQIRDEDMRNRYIKRMQKLQLRKNRCSMIEDAKSVHPVLMDAFDSDKFLFNCQNGTLDLKTLKFRAHDPQDFITKVSPVTFNPQATCDRWIQFIDEVMMSKKDVARYLQKAIGYSLTGDTSLECLFIMYGPTTRNGKTTLIDTILKLMGDYGRSAKPDMLASNFKGPSNGSPSEDVARLVGARFVGISEMEQKLAINASLTKQLTGNNIITARFLHENSFEFRLQAKIFIDTNHLPNVNDQTLFESGRLKIIPFNRHFKAREQDKSLKTVLTEDDALSGILNWVIEGYQLYRTEGLNEPDEVNLATIQYRRDSDRISQFVETWLEKGAYEDGSPYQVPCKAVYRVYSRWCTEMNYHPDNYKNFRAAMEKNHVVITRRPRGGGEKTPLIFGVRLRKEEAGFEEECADVFEPLSDEHSSI